jgi:hypothetical protein
MRAWGRFLGFQNRLLSFLFGLIFLFLLKRVHWQAARAMVAAATRPGRRNRPTGTNEHCRCLRAVGV